MNIMGCRIFNIQAAYEGLLKTGYSLIGFKDNLLAPLLTGDDLGIYIIIPRLAVFFGCSIDVATKIFFFGLLYIPFCVATVIFLFYFESWIERIFGVIGLALITRVAYGLGDVYLAFYAAAMIQIPFSLWFFKSKRAWYGATGFFGGILSGLLHIIRSYSFVAGIIFFSMLLVVSKNSLKRTLYLVASFFFAFSVSIALVQMMHNSSMKFAKENLNADKVENAHVFWHQVYIGFGFLEWGNKNEISYSDEVAAQKVLEIDPTVRYCSAEYEQILKNETINLLINQWKFFIITLFAKLGVLIYFFVKFCNLGMIAAIFFPSKRYIDCAFLGALCFNAIPCLIALPFPEYALGFITCAALFGIININNALRYMQKNTLSTKKILNFQF